MNRDTALRVSLETLIGSSGMITHELEDRQSIRDSQDRELLARIQEASSVRLADPRQENDFCVAPLDVLVTGPDSRGRRAYHIIELNGTGIGGLTNLTDEAVAAVLAGLTDMARRHRAAEPLILIASSGKEDQNRPRLNRLVHEKMLYCDALREGFLKAGHPKAVTTNLNQIQAEPGRIDHGMPTMVLGYIGELLDALSLREDGRLMLDGRPVTGAVNDRFCMNVLDRFDRRVDMRHFDCMNRCFAAGADKGFAYELMREYFTSGPENPEFPRPDFEHAENREELIECVSRWVRWGRQAVIKPHATGLGHGIEFFLNPDEPVEGIIERIDGSITATAELYQTPGGSFPYTICPFLDTALISKPGHPFVGRKYELRVVVYRDGPMLRAFPSIVKVACDAFDPANPSRESLINNITASNQKTRQAGTEHMLPLCNLETLELLGIGVEELTRLCRTATGYVGHVLDKVTAEPERFLLPRTTVTMPSRVPLEVSRAA